MLGAKVARQSQAEVEDDETDNSALHGGRIRTFKHERGNWATFVYIPVVACADQLEEFQTEAIEKLAPHIALQANDALHLSLSRTVVLQYHQIDEFSKSLQHALQNSAGYVRNSFLLATNY